MKKRILACLLTAMLISAVLPVHASAAASTDIASGSWVCVDEALRIVVTMPDADGASNVGAYINGSEKAAVTARISGASATVVIPKNALLPGDNDVSFKATNANGEQVGEAYSIIINGFKPLNSTVISATDFNSTSDAYEASYNATLANDGWTYNDYTAQTSYLSPEVLYGCDTAIWTNISGGHSVSRVSKSDNTDDKYLQYTTSSSTYGTLEFKLKERAHSYLGDIIKLSMDIYVGTDDTIRKTDTYSCIEETTCDYKQTPFTNIPKSIGWYKVIGYFDPAKTVGVVYLYNNVGNLLGCEIDAWNPEQNGLKLTGSNGSFGFKIGLKKGKTAGFDNIKFERLSLGHYEDFSVTMSETELEGVYADSAAMTVTAYGEGAKVYIDGVKVDADITNGAEKVYNIDGAKLNYGIKNIRVDYKRVNEFEPIIKEITLQQTSDGQPLYCVRYLTGITANLPALEPKVLSNSDLATGIRIKVNQKFPSGDDFRAEIYEIDETGKVKDVSNNFKPADWKTNGVQYAIVPKSGHQFNPNCFYKVLIDGHSICFYTPGDSGAYLNLYDAQLTDGNFSVMVEKAASAALANPVKLIVAVYNGDELVKVLTKDLEIAKGVDATGVNLSFTEKATRAKAFIFDGLDSITPLTADIEAK